MLYQVYSIASGSTMPSIRRHPPDTLIGSGPSNGIFNIAVPPLAVNQCVYVCDTCTTLTSDVDLCASAGPGAGDVTAHDRGRHAGARTGRDRQPAAAETRQLTTLVN